VTSSSLTHDALEIAAEGTRQILPDAEGVFDAISRIGYEFEHAVADLIDNAIDAKAADVLVRFIHDGRSVQSVCVIDDGEGMTSKELDTAMAFGARTGKGDDSLG
jgi:signal transduction histidine kinase